MKNVKKIFALAVIGFLFVHGNVYASAFVKLGRGLTNVITSPAEMAYQSYELAKTNNMWIAWMGGVPKALFIYFPLRAAVGIYDTVTFPIPFPKHYEPLVKPETLIEGFSFE